MKHARDDYNRIQDPAGLIPADEPVFLIRGQDRYAAEVLRYYANLVSGGNIMSFELKARNELPEIARATLEQSDRMEAWPTKKTPDL